MAENQQEKQIEIGFAGGQSVSVRLSDSDYDSLRKALESAAGWHELETADGPIALDLRQVVFVKADTSEHKIGFSGL